MSYYDDCDENYDDCDDGIIAWGGESHDFIKRENGDLAIISEGYQFVQHRGQDIGEADYWDTWDKCGLDAYKPKYRPIIEELGRNLAEGERIPLVWPDDID